MFDLLTVGYLFLGGVGGGLCLVLSFMGLSIPQCFLGLNVPCEYRRFFQSGYALSLTVLAVACFCLLVDARGSDAVLCVFFSGRFTYLFVGAYALVVAMMACVALVATWSTVGTGKLSLLRTLQVVALLSGFVVALYTGFYLSAMRSIPLWNTPWIPSLFFLSAVSCALATVFLIAQFANAYETFHEYFRRVATADVMVVVLEMACLIGVVVPAFLGEGSGSTASAARLSALLLLTGDYAPLFWLGFVGLSLIPLLFDIMMAAGRLTKAGLLYFSSAAFASALFGAFFLRYCLIMVGAHPVATLLGA